MSWWHVLFSKTSPRNRACSQIMGLHHKQFSSDLYPGKLAQSIFISAVSEHLPVPVQGGRAAKGVTRREQRGSCEPGRVLRHFCTACGGTHNSYLIWGQWQEQPQLQHPPSQICPLIFHPLQQIPAGFALQIKPCTQNPTKKRQDL